MNTQTSRFPRLAALFGLLVFCSLAQPALAQEVSASASLSANNTTLGQPVELTLTINGTGQVAGRPEITVDGLEIGYQGQSTQMRMENFSVTSSVTLTYLVNPLRTGTFTIPGVRMKLDDKILMTQPLTLNVTTAPPNSGTPGAGTPGGGNDENARLAFAEWVAPKTSAYVGESLPVELHLYLKENVRWQLQGLPVVNGDGFTTQKFPNPRESNARRDGVAYNLIVFKTAITPIKPGEIVLPAVEINAIALVTRRRAPGSRPPGFPDPFSDPFFDQAFAVQQPVNVKPDAVTLTVKSLPVAGRPKSFSGAVGQFSFQSSASPLKGRVGDPITVRSVVTGVGSFDRMEAPQVLEMSGWKSYPPSKKFQPDDDVGISGSKTFEMALIPDTPATELPAVEFSFFDPSKEQYVTLRGEKVALEITGNGAAPTPPPATASTGAGTKGAASPSVAPSAGAKPLNAATDILHIRTDSVGWGAKFQQAWQTRGFWLAQVIPLAALLALTVWGWLRSRGENRASLRLAALRREKGELARKLNDASATPEAFYGAAVALLQVQTALRTRLQHPERMPAEIDADAVLAGREGLDAITEQGVRRLFAKHDEFRYAGASNGGAGVSPAERQATLELLEVLEKGA